MAPGPRGGPLYKILPTAHWAAAGDNVPEAEVDRADGFVHLSAAHQVRETAAKHFAGQFDLTLLEVDAGRIPDGTLRWEVSRGGDHFPHVFGPLPRSAVVGVDALAATGEGFRFPPQVPEPLLGEPDPAALAKRLELAECSVMLALARVAKQVMPERRPAHRMIGHAVATTFGPASPINCIKGLGVAESFEARALEEAEAFFREAGAGAAVEVSERADPEVERVLRAQGYRIAESESVLARPLDGALAIDGATPSKATLEPVAPDDVDAWCTGVGHGFTSGGEGAAELARYARLSHDVGHTRSFWIVADGVRVGTCGLRFDHELAMMLGSAVVPEHRGRGHHQAALVARLELAAAQGCRWAKVDAQSDGASRRNAVRLGFTLSHTRTAWTAGP